MASEDKCHVWRNPLELFEDRDKIVKICAPMVRYSKLPFRMLVRKYGCDLAFTPMIISDSFVKSVKARDSEFTTCKEDRPLVVQFAASNAQDLADAAEIIAPYADGVDLNCGCPQRWAMQEGYGACLIKKPELIKDMVSQTRSRVSRSGFAVSIKIRLRQNERETVELCQRAEKAGASWITVHGRTPSQRAQPVNLDAIKLIKENVDIPVVANGDIKTQEDCQMVRERTGVDGVMAARGMLENPAMFAGFETTPVECVKDWKITRFQCTICQDVDFNKMHYCERHLTAMHSGFGYRCSGCRQIVARYDVKHPSCMTKGSHIEIIKKSTMTFTPEEELEYAAFQRGRRQHCLKIERLPRTAIERQEARRVSELNSRKAKASPKPSPKIKSVITLPKTDPKPPADGPTEAPITDKAPSRKRTTPMRPFNKKKSTTREWLKEKRTKTSSAPIIATSSSSSSSSSSAGSAQNTTLSQDLALSETGQHSSKPVEVELSLAVEEYAVECVPDTTPTYVPSDKIAIKLKGMALNQAQRVVLNIAGTKFETCATTLQADPSGILAQMIKKDSPHQPYEVDTLYTYFIDRDPKHFRTILNYLRNINLVPVHRTLPMGNVNLEELLAEAVFYELKGLESLVRERLGETQ